MTERGFYIVSDRFFDDFPDPYLKGNKREQRPHYYCLVDKKTNLKWFIPMSSRVEKYQKIIDSKVKNGKPCDILHIAKLDSETESVFLIQDMFPITDEYIEREYTVAQNHLRVTNKNLATTIEKKAKRVLNMLRKNIKFTKTQPDVLLIEKTLLQRGD